MFWTVAPNKQPTKTPAPMTIVSMISTTNAITASINLIKKTRNPIPFHLLMVESSYASEVSTKGWYPNRALFRDLFHALFILLLKGGLGVGVAVGVGASVGVDVGIGVGVRVGVSVGIVVWVDVGIGVCVVGMFVSGSPVVLFAICFPDEVTTGVGILLPTKSLPESAAATIVIANSPSIKEPATTGDTT